MSNRQRIERFWEAIGSGDIDAIEACLHPEVVARYPQSGEVIRGRDNYMALFSQYPGGLPKTEPTRLVGDQKTTVIPSSRPFGTPVVTVTGGDELYVGESITTYPDGGVFYVVSIYKMRDRLIAEDTSYFGAPFDPPEWRARYVET